ncbi:alginate export family protein [Acanthopleuribacter pedis]|uniref:Alginate export family protein n=1 Tax=Acanthopleuribacter pedis TaxID=442870 RepID=A0A8J7QKF1_9BACT|nr:alginate export family protein [Acanthopleuribacter pedis]MBO1319838.1 alginate export family protein [Acanthopleuribacter pedis]
MSHTRFCSLLLLLLGMFFPSNLWAWQESRYQLGMDLRLRWEDKQDFNFRGGDQSYLLTRLRLHGAYHFSANAQAFVEIQDARVHEEDRFGTPPLNEDAVPNIFADEFDIHQAYIQFGVGNGKVKIGRQKFNFADKRMVASLEWANTARVFDAVRLTFGGKDTRRWDVWASQPVTVNPNDPNDWQRVGNRYFDSRFYGVMFRDPLSIQDGAYELFLMHRDNSEFGDAVFHAGARLTKKFGKLSVDAQAHQQFGDWNDGDHKATAYALLGKYTTENDFFKNIALGYLSASGDDNFADGDHETFDNLYPLNHAYYGFMDFFGWQNMSNLELIFSGQAFPNGTWRVALHRFTINEPESDAWYNAGLGRFGNPVAGARDDHAGDEIDFTLVFPIWEKRIKMLLGYSLFQAGDYVSERGGDQDARFWYAQALYKWSTKK